MANNGEIVYAFGDEDEQQVEPQELNLEVEPDEYKFSLEDLTSAQDLLKFPIGLRIMYLFHKKGGPMVVTKPIATWTAKEFVSFAAVAASLGSSRMKQEPIGKLEWVPTPELENATGEAIKASLVVPKAAAISIVTDISLIPLLLETKGAQLNEDINYKYASIVVPGAPMSVRVGASGYTRGRVISGGSEYVNWYNRAFGEHLVYIETSVMARRLISVFQIMYRIDSETSDSLVIVEQTYEWRHKVLKAYEEPSPVAKRIAKRVKTLLEQGYRNSANRQPAGMGLKSLVYLEFLMDRVLGALKQDLLDVLTADMDQLTAIEKQRWDKFSAANGHLFGKPEEKEMADAWRTFAKGELVVPGVDGPVRTKGIALKFVDDSRKFVRTNHDLERKSDALTSGFVGGSITSVPIKIHTAISYLKSMCDVPSDYKFPQVDAWGVHTACHWYWQVRKSADKVVWRDKDKNSRIPVASDEIVHSDVEQIAPGSKVGQFIFDDTYNARAEGLAMNADAKVRAVIAAAYEGGFVKMYYGGGIEAVSPVGAMSPHVLSFYDAYEQVALAPGGSPHSPEYFIVFNKRRPPINERGERIRSCNWVPPKKVGLKAFTKPGCEFTGKADPDEPDNKYEQRVMAYFNTWYVVFGFEMLRMNICINWDILNCVRRERNLIHTIVPEHMGVIDMAGARALSTRIREEDVSQSEFAEDAFSF